MKLKKIFLFFVAILLLVGNNAFAQRKHKHKIIDTTGNLLWSKLVWRTFDLTDTNSNIALLALYDTMGNKMNFNQVIAKELKNHTIKAYNISQNFKDMEDTVRINGDGFDTWVYDDADNKAYTKDSSLKVQDNIWQKMDEINDLSVDTSNKYFILEYWAFYRNTGQMTVTIQWIGPCGKEEGGGLKPLFAIKYKDLAPLLDHYTLWQPCQKGTSYSCYDFFETRWFSSRIIKIAGLNDKAYQDMIED